MIRTCFLILFFLLLCQQSYGQYRTVVLGTKNGVTWSLYGIIHRGGIIEYDRENRLKGSVSKHRRAIASSKLSDVVIEIELEECYKYVAVIDSFAHDKPIKNRSTNRPFLEPGDRFIYVEDFCSPDSSDDFFGPIPLPPELRPIYTGIVELNEAQLPKSVPSFHEPTLTEMKWNMSGLKRQLQVNQDRFLDLDRDLAGLGDQVGTLQQQMGANAGAVARMDSVQLGNGQLLGEVRDDVNSVLNILRNTPLVSECDYTWLYYLLIGIILAILIGSYIISRSIRKCCCCKEEKKEGKEKQANSVENGDTVVVVINGGRRPKRVYGKYQSISNGYLQLKVNIQGSEKQLISYSNSVVQSITVVKKGPKIAKNLVQRLMVYLKENFSLKAFKSEG